MTEKTIASFQTENHRIQLVVKNNNLYIIDNRRIIHVPEDFFTDNEKTEFNKEYTYYVYFRHYCNKIYCNEIFNMIKCDYNVKNTKYNPFYINDIISHYIYKR